MNRYRVAFWKEAPCIRIIIPFIAGIAVSYYSELHQKTCITITAIALCALTCYSLASLHLKFRLRYVAGIIINVFIAAAGALLAGIKNPFKKQNNLLQFNNYAEKPVYFITLSEP